MTLSAFVDLTADLVLRIRFLSADFAAGTGLAEAVAFAARIAAMLRATDPRTPRPPLAMVLALAALLLIFAVCVARSFPPAVRSLPPRAVAPWPPTLVILPALSLVRRFLPLLTGLAAGRPDRVLPPPPANLPFASRL